MFTAKTSTRSWWPITAAQLQLAAAESGARRPGVGRTGASGRAVSPMMASVEPRVGPRRWWDLIRTMTIYVLRRRRGHHVDSSRAKGGTRHRRARRMSARFDSRLGRGQPPSMTTQRPLRDPGRQGSAFTGIDDILCMGTHRLKRQHRALQAPGMPDIRITIRVWRDRRPTDRLSRRGPDHWAVAQGPPITSGSVEE